MVEINKLTDDFLTNIARQDAIQAQGLEVSISNMPSDYIVEKIQYWLGYMDVGRLVKYSLDWLVSHFRFLSVCISESMKYFTDDEVLTSIDDIYRDVNQFILLNTYNNHRQRRVLQSNPNSKKDITKYKWTLIVYFHECLNEFVSIKERLKTVYDSILDLYPNPESQLEEGRKRLDDELNSYRKIGFQLGMVLSIIKQNKHNVMQKSEIVNMITLKGIDDVWVERVVDDLIVHV